MSEDSRRSRVTITLGRSGQVVSRDGSDLDSGYELPRAGTKRSVKERLGNQLDSSIYGSDAVNKRQRGQASSFSGLQISGNDLRLKLIEKSAQKRAQSDEGSTMDLREKLSRSEKLPRSLDNRVCMAEPRDGPLPPLRSARGSSQMLSSSSAYSPWARDDIRRRSPDGFVGSSRGLSPPRNSGSIIGAPRGLSPSRNVGRIIGNPRGLSPPRNAGSIIGTPRGLSPPRNAGRTIGNPRGLSPPRSAGRIIDNQRGLSPPRNTGRMIDNQRGLSPPRNAGRVIDNQRGLSPPRNAGSMIGNPRGGSPPRSTGRLTSTPRGLSPPRSGRIIGSPRGLSPPRSGRMIGSPRDISPPRNTRSFSSGSRALSPTRGSGSYMGSSRGYSPLRNPGSYMGSSRGSPPSRNIDDFHGRSRMLDDVRAPPYIARSVLNSQAPASGTTFTRPMLPPPVPNPHPLPPLGQLPPLGSMMQNSPYSVEDPLTVDDFLNSLGLGKYSLAFKREEVDMNTIKQMKESDLKDLIIPMGPRKKILQAIACLPR